MKHTFTLLSLFVATLAIGQSDFTKYQKLVDDIAKYAATPHQFFVQDSRQAGGELTHNLDSIISIAGKSFVIEKQFMEYNEDGTTHQIYGYGLDSGEVELKLQSIITFTYDGIDLPNNLLVESRNPDTKSLEEAIGVTIEYDAEKRVDTVVVSLPDPLSGDFGPLLGLQYVYDGDHLVQSRQWLYASFLGSWIPGSVTDFQYDQDLLVEQETSAFDFLTMQVVPSSRATFSYNAQSLRDTVWQFLWVDPDWQPSQRYAIDYYGNETIANEYGHVHDGSMYVNNSWTYYPVEEVDDQFSVVNYLYNQIGGEYEVQDSTSNLLNPSLQWNQVAAPSELAILSILGEVNVNSPFFGTGSVTDRIDYAVYDTLSNGLVPVGKDFYHYSLRKKSSVSDVLPQYLTIAPNPAQNHFTITLDENVKATYTVYAANGAQQVQGVVQQGANHIQTSAWPQGVYYILITTEDGKAFAHKQLVQ